MFFRKHTGSPEKPKRSRRSVILRRFLILILFIVLVIGGITAFEVYVSASKLTGTKNPIKLISSALQDTSLKTTDGRTNILLAGYSIDDPGHQGAELTDSIMVVSIDASNHSVTMISIPRDLYVNIPGYGYSKINAAYEDGQAENFSESGYPSGGMGLLEQIITQKFGIQFNYYALIDYTAFRDAVNAVGGVTVTINSSDSRGLYDPNTGIDLPNGTVTLDGQQALALARSRGDGYGSYGFPDGDFNRTQNQQLLLTALAKKVSSLSTLANPLKLTSVLDALSSNVKTDFSIGTLRTLYSTAKYAQNSKSVTNVTLNDYDGQDLLSDYTTDSGEDALIPAAGFDDYSVIKAAISSLLQPTITSRSSSDSAN